MRSARTGPSCKALIDAGTTDIDYDGVSGPQDMSGNGEPIAGSYAILQFGEDNRIDDSKTTFKGGQAPPEVNDIPLAETEGTRAGDGVLKIGTLLPETGSLAFLGPPEIAGVKVAIEEINAAGGVLGKPTSSRPSPTRVTPAPTSPARRSTGCCPRTSTPSSAPPRRR